MKLKDMHMQKADDMREIEILLLFGDDKYESRRFRKADDAEIIARDMIEFGEQILDRIKTERTVELERIKTMKAEEWNEKYPVGTEVTYQSVIGVTEHRRTITRSEAWELGHGEVVVQIKGRTGCVAITHLTLWVEKDG